MVAPATCHLAPARTALGSRLEELGILLQRQHGHRQLRHGMRLNRQGVDGGLHLSPRQRTERTVRNQPRLDGWFKSLTLTKKNGKKTTTISKITKFMV